MLRGASDGSISRLEKNPDSGADRSRARGTAAHVDHVGFPEPLIAKPELLVQAPDFGIAESIKTTGKKRARIATLIR